MAAAAIGSAVDRPTCSWVLALALADELAAPCTLRVAIAITALQLPCASLEGSMAPLRCGKRTMASALWILGGRQAAGGRGTASTKYAGSHGLQRIRCAWRAYHWAWHVALQTSRAGHLKTYAC